MRLKQIPPHTLITAFAAVAWLASFPLRSMNPGFNLGPAADTLMATCVAWWMKMQKASGKADGLMVEVVENIALPYISTAHSNKVQPKPTLGSTTPSVVQPKPTLGSTTPSVVQPKPPTPRPVQPTTKPTGGLPWET